jgi:uncharacterized protein (TIGR02271 family)
MTVPSRTEDNRASDKTGETVIPLLAEEIEVSKQVVETGRVQVGRVTHEREQLIDELLAHETAEIDRTPIGRQVDTMPAVREEGDTVVIPIVEEVLVIERRLLLKEEVRVRRVRSTERHQESVTLRHHEAVVTRLPVEPPAAGQSPRLAQSRSSPTRRDSMSYQTIVAAFDTAAHAQAAVEALKAGGFHADDISVFDKNRVGLREPGLWQRMFGGGLAQHEADVYSQSLERGGMVVSVRVPESEVAHATGILDIHRPIDVHDRAVTTGIAPAAKVEAAVASIAAKPIEVAQTVAVSPKLAEAHDEVLRLAEEQLEVGKRMVETGRTRVRRFVTEREVSAEVTLHEEHADVLRRAVTDPKYVGEIDWADSTIEVIETAEQALVSKTARVVEEVGLRKIGSDHVETVHDKIRRQQVEIERLGPDGRPIPARP